MKQEILISLGIGLVIGLTVGYLLGKSSEGPATPVAAAPTAMEMPPAGAAPMGMPGLAPKVNNQAKIAVLLEATQRDPKDVKAWIGLGNEYFGIHQHQPAIDAYGKALALEPNNPDVLTDQGVMYREMKAVDKALANFEKAQKLNPQHLQSLFNIGVVYADDLKKPDKAQKAWERVMALDPTGPHGQAARQSMERLRAQKP